MSTTWRNKFFERIDCKGVALNEGDGEILVQGEVNTDSPDPTIVYWAPNPPTYSTSFSGSALPYHDSIQAYDRTPNIGAVKAVNRKFQFRIKYPNAYYIGLGSLYVPPHIHFKICEDDSWQDGTGGIRWIMPTPDNTIDNNEGNNMNVNRLNNANNNNNEVNNNNVNSNNNNNKKSDNLYHTIQIDEGVPFRTLTYPAPPSNNPRDSPMFYYCNKSKLPVRTQEQVLLDSGYPEVNDMPNNFWGLKPPL